MRKTQLEKFELHPDRLATTDAAGHRVFLYQADVRGRWRSRRTWVQSFLIIFLLILPWLKMNGRQLILLDLPGRHFFVFGLTVRAHDVPLLFFLIATVFAAGILVTALWGRIWCGWTCPQTVFIDGLFRRIERWIEGAALSRRSLDQGKFTLVKLGKKTFKWIIFVFCSVVITHSVLAFFVGASRVIEMMQSSPSSNWSYFIAVMTGTAVILFDFGWFREQFCIIMCPYGRMQTLLMDKNSLAITYDSQRGEPRRPYRKLAEVAQTSENSLTKVSSGDCVNCFRCVQVCPTGVDIRRGLQLECIACTACVDACDDVMTKIKKPKGLIRYASEASFVWGKSRLLRVRTVLSAALFMVGLLVTVSLVSIRPSLDVVVLRAKGEPYSVDSSSGETMITNHFRVELNNSTRLEKKVYFRLHADLELKGVKIVTQLVPLAIASEELKRADFFIRFPKEILVSGVKKIHITIFHINEKLANETGNQNKDLNEVEVEKEVSLVGPLA